jgi:uncharacterized membrane protein YbaN (DUF454 family)
MLPPMLITTLTFRKAISWFSRRSGTGSPMLNRHTIFGAQSHRRSSWSANTRKANDADQLCKHIKHHR